MNQTPKWKEREWWIMVLTTLANIAGLVAGVLPADKAAVVQAIIGGAFCIARGLAKSAPAIMVEPGKPMPDGGPKTVMGDAK